MDYKTLYIILVSLGVIGIIYYFFPQGLVKPTPPPLPPPDYDFGTLNPMDEDEVIGCTDPDADNYSSIATIDSGECLTAGCTDVDATNYDPNANYDPYNNLCSYGMVSSGIDSYTDPNPSWFDNFWWSWTTN